jgi:hypothetical protein
MELQRYFRETRRAMPVVLIVGGMMCGCAENAYQRVRLGETDQQALASILGGGPYQKNAWARQSWGIGLLGGWTTVAVLCDADGRSRAKVLLDYVPAQQSGTGASYCGERVEIRLDPAEMERIVRACAHRPVDELAGEWKARKSPTSCPTDGSARLSVPDPPTDLAEAVKALAGSLKSAREKPAGRKVAAEDEPMMTLSEEQVPLVMLLGLYAIPLNKPPTSDPDDQAVHLLLRTMMAIMRTHDALHGGLSLAEAKHLHSSPTPVDFSVGGCRVRKIAAGWYELHVEAGWAWVEGRKPCSSQPAQAASSTAERSVERRGATGEGGG